MKERKQNESMNSTAGVCMNQYGSVYFCPQGLFDPATGPVDRACGAYGRVCADLPQACPQTLWQGRIGPVDRACQSHPGTSAGLWRG